MIPALFFPPTHNKPECFIALLGKMLQSCSSHFRKKDSEKPTMIQINQILTFWSKCFIEISYVKKKTNTCDDVSSLPCGELELWSTTGRPKSLNPTTEKQKTAEKQRSSKQHLSLWSWILSMLVALNWWSLRTHIWWRLRTPISSTKIKTLAYFLLCLVHKWLSLTK